MKKNGLYTAVALTAALTYANADEWSPVGARAQGMAGAQVASPEGSQSILSNAAFLAKDARADGAFHLSGTLGAEGDIVTKADSLINSYNDKDSNNLSVEDAFNNLENPGSATDYSNSVGRIVKFLATDAAVLDAPGQGILANVQGALTMRFGRLGLYAGYKALGGASVRYDSNLGFKSTGGS